jgi:hypothetical protein
VIKAWQQINPKNLPSVPIEKLAGLVQYVFESGKDELEVELDDDTDCVQMVMDFVYDRQLQGNKAFTFDQTLELLNWAVDLGEEEEEREQEQQEQEQEQQEQEQEQQEQEQEQQEENEEQSTKPQPQ